MADTTIIHKQIFYTIEIIKILVVKYIVCMDNFSMLYYNYIYTNNNYYLRRTTKWKNGFVQYVVMFMILR